MQQAERDFDAFMARKIDEEEEYVFSPEYRITVPFKDNLPDLKIPLGQANAIPAVVGFMYLIKFHLKNHFDDEVMGEMTLEKYNTRKAIWEKNNFSYNNWRWFDQLELIYGDILNHETNKRSN